MPICAEQDDLVTEIDLAFKKACARGTFNQDLFNEEIANYQKSANEEFGL